MKTIPKHFYLSMISFVLFTNCFGQAGDSAKQKTQFKLSVNYNSHLNYYGRTDSLRSSGIFPMAEVWFTPDVYINAAPVFVNNKLSQFDYAGTVATIGYQHVSAKSITSVYFLKPFYTQQSQLVQAALKAQTGFTVTWLNKLIDLTAGADAKFSDKTDFGLSGGIDHLVKKQFADNAVLVIDPSAFIYAGTQQFTNTYLKHNNFLLLPGTPQQLSESVNHFNVLSYEFSVPVVFAKSKLQLLLTPSYVIPQNLIEGENNNGAAETGRKMLYATAAVKVTL